MGLDTGGFRKSLQAILGVPRWVWERLGVTSTCTTRAEGGEAKGFCTSSARSFQVGLLLTFKPQHPRS